MITGDRISDCDNTDEDEMIVNVYEAPSAEFTCPAMAEKGKPVIFELRNEELKSEKSVLNSQFSILNSRWDFGDGGHGEGNRVEHTFVKSGNYVVTLTVRTDAKTDCNTSSLQKRITINEPPVAAAGEDCQTGVNQIVIFDGSASKDEDGVISSYSWDFGDGQTGRGVRVRHQYQRSGKYKATLTVTDNTNLSNNSASDTLTVTVNSSPKPIVSIGESPETIADVQSSGASVCPGKEVILSAKNSLDPDGEIISYSWNFGDGSAPKKGQEVKHTWRSAGTYSLVLEVDDGTELNNSRAQASLIITANHPPIADGGADRIVSPDEDVRFDASASKDRDGKLTGFQWDFGDGSKAQGATAVHRYQKPGKYLVKLRVTDDSGTTCSTVEDVVNVRVNASPVADAGKDREAYIGEANDALVFDATGSSDSDGDPLIFYWDFGDGEKAQGASVIHRYQKPGKYTVTLKADDGTKLKSGIAQDQVTVQVRQRR
jgi:PKD repeat protein